jgi:hypothetical protein
MVEVRTMAGRPGPIGPTPEWHMRVNEFVQQSFGPPPASVSSCDRRAPGKPPAFWFVGFVGDCVRDTAPGRADGRPDTWVTG